MSALSTRDQRHLVLARAQIDAAIGAAIDGDDEDALIAIDAAAQILAETRARIDGTWVGRIEPETRDVLADATRAPTTLDQRMEAAR